MRAYLVVFILLIFPIDAFAAWHLYIVPVIGTGTSREDCRRPKYIRPDGCAVSAPIAYTMMDYGFQPTAVVAADVTASQDATLQNNGDVTRIPDNLDTTLAGSVGTIQNALEAEFIPGNWITGGTTYRILLRNIVGMFSWFQRYAVISGSNEPVITGNSVTLNTRFDRLAPNVRANLLLAAESLNVDLSTINVTFSLRQILRQLGEYFVTQQWTIGSVII